MLQMSLKASQLQSRLIAIEMIVAVPTVLVMSSYARSILYFESAEWVSLCEVLFVYAVTAAVVGQTLRRKTLRPLVECLAAREQDEPSHEQLREGFRAAVRIPSLLQRSQFALWGIAAVFVPAGMVILGHDRWGSGFRLFAMVPVALTGGMAASTVLFFLAKEGLAEIREVLASDFDDPEERCSLISPVTIARKVRVVVAGSGVVLVVCVLGFAYARAREAVDGTTALWQAQTLAQLAHRVEEQPAGVAREALAELVPYEARPPFDVEYFVLDGPLLLAEAGLEDVPRKLADGLRSGAPTGTVPSSARGVFVWRSLVDGRILVSRVAGGEVAASVDGFGLSLFMVFVMTTALLMSVSQLLARDISRATQLLSAEAGRMAQGDLRKGRVFESEDELGTLARAFEGMGSALRSTVARVADAADRVDAAASDMAGVSEGVAVATADQVRRIHQAGDIMGKINTQVTTISTSAQALNASVEESSSSILELGAAGDELNDTASVLSTKVEEVTNSIEQMVASVKQVRSTSESLSDVAADTSSSMEEMASAMRAVDTTAELTAKLSAEVVQSAESGQRKVSQTIEGMQAISDATMTAEGVIRGLGARTKEIGAILDVIDDVADETNLLALNAAIIAAQAGEHGRAFSVVADEIKELADRVLASTKEIGGLISSVQEESTNAIGAIEDGSRSVAGGVELSAEAGTSLEEINRASRESGERIGQIVVAVREQTKAATFVVSLMDRVKGGVEQITVAGSEQDRGNEIVYRSSVTMREVAQQVRRTTEEQSRGFGRIRESVEGVREAVEQINGSLQDQSASCHQVAEFLEQVSDGTRSNEEAVQRLGGSIRGLVSQAEALREDVAKFQV